MNEKPGIAIGLPIIGGNEDLGKLAGGLFNSLEINTLKTSQIPHPSEYFSKTTVNGLTEKGSLMINKAKLFFESISKKDLFKDVGPTIKSHIYEFLNNIGGSIKNENKTIEDYNYETAFISIFGSNKDTDDFHISFKTANYIINSLQKSNADLYSTKRGLESHRKRLIVSLLGDNLPQIKVTVQETNMDHLAKNKNTTDRLINNLRILTRSHMQIQGLIINYISSTLAGMELEEKGMEATNIEKDLTFSLLTQLGAGNTSSLHVGVDSKLILSGIEDLKKLVDKTENYDKIIEEQKYKFIISLLKDNNIETA